MQNNVCVPDYIDGDVVSFSIDGLTVGASYSFSIQASNEFGTSGTTAGDMSVRITGSYMYAMYSEHIHQTYCNLRFSHIYGSWNSHLDGGRWLPFA